MMPVPRVFAINHSLFIRYSIAAPGRATPQNHGLPCSRTGLNIDPENMIFGAEKYEKNINFKTIYSLDDFNGTWIVGKLVMPSI